jgi:hypothetical protein
MIETHPLLVQQLHWVLEAIAQRIHREAQEVG